VLKGEAVILCSDRCDHRAGGLLTALAVRATLDDSAALYTDGLNRLQQLVVATPDGSVISLDKGSFVSSIAGALITGETRVRGAK